VDGIIGVGPVGLTQSTLSPDAESTIPTITDNLFTSGVIGANILGVSFEPTTSANSETNGELTWGGTDPTKSTGEITYTPITTTFPANTFWGIDTSVAYGSASILGLTAGIVDTGTTLVQLATDAFQVYQSATGGVADSATGLLSLTPAQFENLQSLFFTVAGTSFEFTANAQILPRILNSQMGGTPDGIYLIVSDLGTNSGAGLDFILGQTFLERFYSVYDTDNQRVGLATTPFTDATSN
jgi:cathepsin E